MQARHSLAWLSAAGWRAARQSAAPDCHDAIDAWQRADWPAVMRRQDADAGPEQCSLGLALPPAADGGGKKRICLRVPQEEIARTSSPLTIAETLAAAPAAWRPSLAQLGQQASGAGLALRVYGSLALQALTGMNYLRPASDLDLLLFPATAKQLSDALDLLRRSAGDLPLDGEIVFPDGQAVAWKEWQAAVQGRSTARVLVKHLHGVRLARPEELLASLDSTGCAA